MLNALFKISVLVIRGISLYLTNRTFWAEEGCIQLFLLVFNGCNFLDKAPGRDNARMKKCFKDGLL